MRTRKESIKFETRKISQNDQSALFHVCVCCNRAPPAPTADITSLKSDYHNEKKTQNTKKILPTTMTIYLDSQKEAYQNRRQLHPLCIRHDNFYSFLRYKFCLFLYV